MSGTGERTTSSGMRYHVRGEGRPLVFLHGWCLSRRMWIYAEEAFSASRRVVLPDLPGFGCSEGLAGPYGFERYADEVALLLDEAELDDAVLAGFAFGAGVAMTLAARGHPRIGALVNVAAPGGEHSPYARMPRSMRRDWPDFARRSAGALLHRSRSDATLGWLERMFAAAPLSTAVPVVEALATFDPRSLAGRIRVPQLFVHASEDSVSPVSLGRACAESAPRGELAVFADCGHLVPVDAAADLHEAIAGFLGAAEGSRAKTETERMA